MSIHKLDGGYVISSGRTWLPGSYADERTAKYAFRISVCELQGLQDSVNPNGTITFAMLQALANERKAKSTVLAEEGP